MLFSAADDYHIRRPKVDTENNHPVYHTVQTLRYKSAECVCNNIRLFSAYHLNKLPPFVLNQLHDLLCHRSLTGATSSLVAHLVSWATLRVDWSNFESISDDCLLSLAACHSLQLLNLNAGNFSRSEPSTQAFLNVLSNMTALQEVQLRRCQQVNDSVVDALTQACGRSLRVLSLHGCSACSDASVRFISERCRAIFSLNLSSTANTDDGIATLAASPLCRLLTELQINQCRDITDASIRLLVDSCPNLKILTFTNCPQLTIESRNALENLRNSGAVRQLSWTVY